MKKAYLMPETQSLAVEMIEMIATTRTEDGTSPGTKKGESDTGPQSNRGGLIDDEDEDVNDVWGNGSVIGGTDDTLE